MSDTPAVKLTKAQRDVLRVLVHHGRQNSSAVAGRALIRGASARDTAEHHLISLTEQGLAKKQETRMRPEWRVTDAGVRALLDALKDEGEAG